METRLIVAYALIVLLAAAIVTVFWLYATRAERRRRRSLANDARWEASRQAAVKASESGREGR